MPQDNTGSFYKPLPRPEKKPDTSQGDTLGTVVRTGAGMYAPLAVRVGSGLMSGLANKIPLAGTAAAGLIGGGGEILAQMLENQGTDKSISWPRVGVEAGLSMIPIGGELRIGKYVKDLSSATRGAAALKGAALAGAGVVGRKATDEDPNTSALNPSSYGLPDAAQVVIGAGIGSLFGKSQPKVPSMGPKTPAEYLDELKLRKAEDINTEASRLEALGDASSRQQAETIRVTAATAKRGNEKTYDAITKSREAAAAQEAKNLGGAAGKGDLPSIEDALAQGPKAVEEFALRAEALGDVKYAEELRKAAVAKGVSSGTTSRAVTRGTAAAKKAELEAKRRSIIETQKQDLLDQGYKEKVTAPVETISAPTDIGGRQSMSVRLSAPAKEGAEDAVPTATAPKGKTPRKAAPPKTSAPPSVPVEPLEGRYQIVRQDGNIIATLDDPKDVERLLTASGPNNGLTVVPPKTVIPEGGLPFNPPRLTEAPAAPVEPTPITPEVPVAPPAEAVKEVIKQKRVRAKATQKAPEVPVEAPVATPEVPIAEAPIPTPVNPTAPIEDIEERVLVKNPMSGRAEPSPGDISTPEKTLILQPKEGGGWTRAEATAKGIKRSETKAPKPPVKAVPEPLDLNKVREDLPNIQDPLVREMAERELGSIPTPDASIENPVPSLEPSAPEIHIHPPSAPQSILDEVEAFQARRAQAMEAAGAAGVSPEEAEAFAKEADALQLKLSLAERAAEQSSKGGSSAGFLGITPDILEAIKSNPQFAMRAGLAGVGGLAGYNLDEEDPLRGAILGGAAGAMAPSLLRRNPNDTGAKISPLDWLGNYQRFSLLSGIPNLGVNVAAPLSGSVMSSAEKMISGKLRGDTAMQEAGRAGLSSLVRPSNYSRDALRNYWQESLRLIREADEGRGDMAGGSPNALATFLRGPANLMTTGDTATRSMLEKGANWTDDMAREATLTNEPRYADTKALTNLVRSGSPLMRFAFPFVKTAANAVEGSAERTPILGMFLRKATGDPNAEATMAEVLTRQGLGGAVGYVAYQLGANVDPDEGKRYYLPLLITNMGGQYGPLAAAAFAAGQASQNGDLREQLLAGSTHFFRDVPLPTTEAPANLIRAGINLFTGEPVNTQTDNPILQKIPSNLIPRFVTQIVQDQEQNAPTSFYTPLPR